jgi:cytochrome P450
LLIAIGGRIVDQVTGRSRHDSFAERQNKQDSWRVMEAFDLYSPAIDANPFPYYEILREQYPCYWNESGKLWILSRYDDIVRAARDWETFSSSQGNMIDELPGRAGATLGTTDPPRHDRLRALSQAAFARKTSAQLVAPTLDIADRALERIRERKEFEFINDFSSQITVGLLFRTMGLPERDHAEIRRKVILAVSTDKSVKGRTAEHIAAFQELSAFLTAEVAARRAKPTDDLITHLAEAEIDGDRLSEREVVLTTATFVMAGVESLSSFMSMFALNLHDYPDARRRIVADPALIEPAIEESLRFNTSAQRFKRTVVREVMLHGETLRVGDKVALAFGSGNRDWRKFPDPDVYDIDRRPQGHLGFGTGKHFCLGSQMARLVTAVAMRRFLERVPNYHFTVDKVAWNSSSNFRSPAALPFAIG